MLGGQTWKHRLPCVSGRASGNGERTILVARYVAVTAHLILQLSTAVAGHHDAIPMGPEGVICQSSPMLESLFDRECGSPVLAFVVVPILCIPCGAALVFLPEFQKFGVVPAMSVHDPAFKSFIAQTGRDREHWRV